MFKRKSNKQSSAQTIRHEGRTASGFAWHIQANPGPENDMTALCGIKMFDFSRNNTDMTSEYLKDLVVTRGAEHSNFFYCNECYEKLVGEPHPSKN